MDKSCVIVLQPWGTVFMDLVEDLGEPVLVELYRYWVERCAGRRAPARSDIDPVDIPHLLPHVVLTEVIDAGARFRIRLAGTKVEERYGCIVTNRIIDEFIHGPYLDYLQGLYRKLLESFAPLYSESVFEPEKAQTLRAKRLMLPLSHDQQSVDMVLAGMIYEPSDPNDRTKVLHAINSFTP